jgi:hypothetical protein
MTASETRPDIARGGTRESASLHEPAALRLRRPGPSRRLPAEFAQNRLEKEKSGLRK